MNKLLLIPTVLLIAVLAITTAGCVTSQPDPNGSIWTLSSYENSGALPHGIISISFDNGSLSGSGGINTYRATYLTTVKTGEISIGPVADTKISGPPLLMDDETRYFAALVQASSYTITNGILTMKDANGQTLLTFKNPLADTAWRLVSYTPSGQSAEQPAEGFVTLFFSSDGSLSGSGGINTYAAAWTLDTSTLSLTQPTASTKMSGPANMIVQENNFLSLFGSVSGLKFSGSTLQLTNSVGDTILTLTPVLSETSWALTAINLQPPSVSLPDTTLVFAGDRTFSGHAPINSYSGEWYQLGVSKLTPGPVAVTLMTGPVDAVAVEQQYFAILGNITTYSVSETQLVLTDKNGNTLTYEQNYADALKGTVWSLLDNREVSLAFSDDGTYISGQAQINSYSADLGFPTHNTMTFTNMLSTKMSGPSALMEEENRYISDLGNVNHCFVTSSRLYLSNAAGDTRLTYVRSL